MLERVFSFRDVFFVRFIASRRVGRGSEPFNVGNATAENKLTAENLNAHGEFPLVEYRNKNALVIQSC